MAELIMQEEAGAPATPSSGKWKAYFKADGLYIIDDAGVETGPIKAKYSDILGGNGEAATLGSGATGSLALYTGFIASGANAPMPKAGTIKNLHIRIAGTQPASGSLVFHIMINNAASIITCTQAAGAGAATIADTTNSVTIVEGDLVYIRAVNNATAASAPVGVFTFELEQSVS